jgi:hypothetical protein
MTTKNEPGKMWKAYAFCKSLASALVTDKTTRSEAKDFGKRSGLAVAGPAAYALVNATVPMLLAIPLVTPIAATVCCATAIGFGIAAWRSGRRMCNTSEMEDNLKDERRKWEAAQLKNGIVKRVKPYIPIAVCSAATLVGGALAGSYGAQRALGEDTPSTIHQTNRSIQNAFRDVAGKRPSDEQMLIWSTFAAGLGAVGVVKSAMDMRRRNSKAGISPAPAAPGVTKP